MTAELMVPEQHTCAILHMLLLLQFLAVCSCNPEKIFCEAGEQQRNRWGLKPERLSHNLTGTDGRQAAQETSLSGKWRDNEMDKKVETGGAQTSSRTAGKSKWQQSEQTSRKPTAAWTKDASVNKTNTQTVDVWSKASLPVLPERRLLLWCCAVEVRCLAAGCFWSSAEVEC